MNLPDRTIILIRHGETDWNKVGRLQGQQDTPLNDTGRQQAQRNGRVLAEYLDTIGRSPDEFRWYASPLSRTRETMEIARSAFGQDLAECTFDDRLKEFDFGDWEGSVLDELKRDRRDEYMARRQDKWNFCPPNGESYAMLRDRVRPWLESTSGDIITVTHGGVIRVLWHLLENQPTKTVTEEEVIQDRFYVLKHGSPAFV